ncbi:uncharacterized protein LOC141537920 [Cotesia typhae]|uniref:uncharacterized protein LOC141537920 n=1 Tax=Cotesia typhae TaxID=2053667 RepID=UPI003D68C3D8
MFIISCDDDNSYCLVHDKDVIQDDEVSAGEDDTIMFYYKKKVCYGKIVFYSGNDDEIDAKWVELTKPRNRKLDKLKFDKKAELSDEKCRQGRKRNSSKVSAKEDDKRSHKLETPVKKVKELRKKTEPKNLEANQSSSQENSLTQDDYKRMYLDLQKKIDDERKSSNVKNKSPGLAITSKRKNKSSSSETESFNSSTEDPFMDTSKSDDTGGESTLGENDKTETEAENNSLADELGEKEKSAGEKEIGASAIEDNLGNKSKNKTDIEATQPEYYDENIQLLGPNHGEKVC